jgi:protein-S-isoprenylcysteine O-methyltransferase Ste14
MIKILIFFIFSLIMLKISWSDIEIVKRSSSVIAGDRMDRGNLYTFKGLLRLLRSLFSLAMTLIQSLIFDTHGRKFYRFFALEFLFLLILVNLGYWLKNPLTIFRITTWMILCGSFVLAGYSIYQLLQNGQPKTVGNIETTTNLAKSKIYQYIRYHIYRSRILLGIETTTSLVTSGIYEYIRHPLYSSLILLGAVTLIKNPSLLATSLFSVATVFLYATAKIEEKENLLKFGEDYAVYMERTNMFIPFL